MARSGVFHPIGFESAVMQATRETRHSHGPGTFWCYNNWDFNALGTIFEQCTGLSLFEAFRDRIAIPCGMEDFRYNAETRDAGNVELEKTVHRAYPFRLRARDLARFGLLYLRGGRWSTRQVVPEKWVRLSVQPYSHADAGGAYGYMWWIVRDGIHFPGAIMPPGFSALGAGGHVLTALPEQDLVLVHRVDTDVGRAVSQFQIGRLFEGSWPQNVEGSFQSRPHAARHVSCHRARPVHRLRRPTDLLTSTPRLEAADDAAGILTLISPQRVAANL